MCGRVRCTLNAAQVGRACGLQDGDADSVRTVDMDCFRSSYNVSPGTYLPVFTVRSDAALGLQAANPCGVVHCMKWGLVPSFTKKADKPDHYRMFNARSESVKEKASFRRLIPHNRCLVAVEGFYEWKKDGSKKQPYYIHFKDGRPLVFAALFDSWENMEGHITSEKLHSFTILTTRSSAALEWLHDRMPVIIGSKDTMNIWSSNSPLKLEAVLSPYAYCDLVWYPVTSAMGNPSFEGPECIKEIPLKLSVQNKISKLFSKKTDYNMNKFKADSEFIKSFDVFTKNENPDCLKEEHAIMEVTKERDESNDLPSVEKRAGIKREPEEMGYDLEDKTELPDGCSTPVKKKLQTADKQSSLHSYFGRK
ncbi:uncharacterized protein LOC110032977 [Phalaenopsis equestris]|uniref:uncharacterized protein LOC110032977 n=1 Tax=Phalaenopsis equestris TaxID=78828 RepID=UPI0009E18FBB|nr:uncharacterized protein LOC110032977 [Phalaenopsis equestris]